MAKKKIKIIFINFVIFYNTSYFRTGVANVSRAAIKYAFKRFAKEILKKFVYKKLCLLKRHE